MLTLLLLNSAASSASDILYKEIEWLDLIPKQDMQILTKPPQSVLAIEDGSDEDNLETLRALSQKDPEAKRFLDALNSTKTVEQFDQSHIGIAGFIVPLEQNEDLKAIKFLIVPYFGACLHLPPPPPNQIILGTSIKGIEVESLIDPLWFDGTLRIDYTPNSLGESAYSLKVDSAVLFEG